MDSTILKSTVLNLLRFLMNSKEQEITKYQIKLQKKLQDILLLLKKGKTSF